MKVTVNIDCTPEEARQFLGLPDIAPMQNAVMEELQKQFFSNLNKMNPDEIMKTWGGFGLQGVTDLQRMIWEQMQAGFGQTTSKDK